MYRSCKPWKSIKGCVRSVLLYGSKTWPLSTEDLSQIKRCNHAMICWLCNVKMEQKHSTEDLRRRIHVHLIQDVRWWIRLRLSGHLYQQEDTSWIKKDQLMMIYARNIWISVWLVTGLNGEIHQTSDTADWIPTHDMYEWNKEMKQPASITYLK